MPEPTAFGLSKHLEGLINRRVDFKNASASQETKAKKVHAVYTLFPQKKALVMTVDLPLLASMAGALVGLPDDEVRQRVSDLPGDELLNDAMHEVCNVASALVAHEGRAVLNGIVFQDVYLTKEAREAMSAPMHRAYFSVEVDGYVGGKMSIFE